MSKSTRANGATPKPTAKDAMSQAASDLTEIGATPSRSRTTKRKPPARTKPATGHAKQGHGKTRFTEDQVAEALKATGGIYSSAARYLSSKYRRKCSRPTISNYVANSPRLQRVIDQIDQSFGDYCEDKLHAFINQGSERSLHFYLSTKGKHRGYTRNVEVTGKNGGPIQTQAQPIDLSGLPPDELSILAELLDRAAQAQPLPGDHTSH